MYVNVRRDCEIWLTAKGETEVSKDGLSGWISEVPGKIMFIDIIVEKVKLGWTESDSTLNFEMYQFPDK